MRTIQIVVRKDYPPMQQKWVTDAEGNQKKAEIAKRIKLG